MRSPSRFENPEFFATSALSKNETGRPPLPPQEVTLLIVTILHLCFLPWALGTMHSWSQLTSLGFSITGFALAALPRRKPRDFSDTPRPWNWPVAKLVRAPAFWAGLTFLGYVTVQGLNPSWRFVSNENFWWLERMDSVTWLPSSVTAPFARGNLWRALIVFVSLGLTVCSVATGFSRRRSFQILFTALIADACILSWFGLLQRLSGATRIFGSYVPSNAAFAASFIYPNHAGAYLNLIAALSAGLAWWHAQRTRRNLEHRGLAGLIIFSSISIAAMVIFSSSRMSVILLATLILFISGSLLLRLSRRKAITGRRPEILYLSVALAVFLCFGLATWRTEKTWNRFAGMAANPENAVRDRTIPRHAAEKMFGDHWFYGWGAGCFQYGFTKYIREYSEKEYGRDSLRLFWEHAHNDLLEFPVELGMAGTIPLLGIIGCASWQLYRRRFWRNVVSLALVAGCILTVVHAAVDFVFQNPAVLLTWSVLLVCALRWAELDQPAKSLARTDQ